MHTPAQLHRSSRDTLTVEHHRLRRATIQRLLQQRLPRSNSHKITARTTLLQLRLPRIIQLQPLPARQQQLPRRRIQQHRLIPHHRDLQVPRTLQLTPRLRLRRDHRTVGINTRHRHHTGLRIRRINPVIRPHRRHHPLRTHQHRLGRFLIKTIHRGRRHRPHLPRRSISHRNHPGTKTHISSTRQLLIPTQAHVRRRHLVQRRTRLIINKHLPRILQNLKRRRRRRHRTIQNPRRIIQPPHSILRLRHHPHTTVVQLHLSGLKPRIQHSTRHHHSNNSTKRSTTNELLMSRFQPKLPQQTCHSVTFPSDCVAGTAALIQNWQ
jgi:hypothetical protein